MTQEEIVDIINEQDQVIGSVPKSHAHKEGLLHRTVIAEIIGSDGKWTLVQQSADRQDAGQYVSPVGGHVQAGEKIEDALKREAFEEFGLTEDLSFKLIGKKVFNREVKGRKENHLFILFEIYTDTPPKLNEEAVATKKFTQEELAEELKNNPKQFGDAFHFVVASFYPHLVIKK